MIVETVDHSSGIPSLSADSHRGVPGAHASPRAVSGVPPETFFGETEQRAREGCDHPKTAARRNFTKPVSNDEGL